MCKFVNVKHSLDLYLLKALCGEFVGVLSFHMDMEERGRYSGELLFQFQYDYIIFI